jgi:O-antigen/teichoic acid export membrane protein
MLAPDEYGVFTLWSAAVLMIGSTAVQWLRQSILRYWKEYEYTEESTQFQHTIIGMTWAVCALLLILGALGSIGFFALSLKHLFILCTTGMLAVIFFCLTTIQLSIWQADRQPGPYAISRIIAAVTTLMVSFVLLMYTGNALALGVGSTAGYSIAVCYVHKTISLILPTSCFERDN